MMEYKDAKKLGTKVFWMRFFYYPYFLLLMLIILLAIKYNLLMLIAFLIGTIPPYIYYAKKLKQINRYLDKYIDEYEKENNIKKTNPRKRYNKLYIFLYEELKCSKDEKHFKQAVELACKNIKYIRE